MSELEDKTREILNEWGAKRGHDRCFWHPDLLERLGKLYGVDMTSATSRISLEIFKKGCMLYQAIEYDLHIPEDCKGIEL